MNPKLKPVTFIQGNYKYHSNNTTQQVLLLKALKITQDPNKLREMIGVKTVADVYRTLDKMAMRKEYHKALDSSGISFSYIVSNIKKEIDTAEKSSDRLNAVKALMKSIGLDKYDDQSIGGGNWEEVLLKNVEAKKNLPAEQKKLETYEVKPPVVPESVRKAQEKQKKEGRSLYE